MKGLQLTDSNFRCGCLSHLKDLLYESPLKIRFQIVHALFRRGEHAILKIDDQRLLHYSTSRLLEGLVHRILINIVIPILIRIKIQEKRVTKPRLEHSSVM